MQTSELFKKEGIKVQEGWINNICSENTDEWHEFLRDPKAKTDCPSDESQEALSETQEILSKNSPSDVNVNGDTIESDNSNDSVDDNDKRVHNRLLKSRFPTHFFPLIPPSRPVSHGNPDPTHFAKAFLL